MFAAACNLMSAADTANFKLHEHHSAVILKYESNQSCDNESLMAGHPPIQSLVIAVQCCNRLLPSQDERYWKDRFHRFR